MAPIGRPKESQLEKAIGIALRAHAGVSDKAGAPYVLHPLRIMLRMADPVDMMVAVLHDVVEDGGPAWTFEALAKEGFSKEIIEALEHVTKLPEEDGDYDSFIRRASRNAIARRVKLADLEDNMRLDRIAEPTKDDFERLKKYQRAHAWLTENGLGASGSD